MFHHEFMRDLICKLNPIDYQPCIAKEISELEENQAPVQTIMVLITAREECINAIHYKETQIDQNQQNKEVVMGNLEKYVDEAMQLLKTLRYISIDVVEAIVEWRNRLAYLASKVPDETEVTNHLFVFQYENENYLSKMKTDTNFLSTSQLKLYLNFSAKSDPFLLNPSSQNIKKKTMVAKGKKKSKKAQKSVKLVNLHIDYQVINRIKACEMVLVEEAVYDELMNQQSTTQTTEQDDNKMIENEPNPEPVTNDQNND